LVPVFGKFNQTASAREGTGDGSGDAGNPPQKAGIQHRGVSTGTNVKAQMIRASVSLPALMQLMGHAHIQTTLIYVQVTTLDIYQQYARAVAQHIRPQ
jgi:hypothetical protein